MARIHLFAEAPPGGSASGQEPPQRNAGGKIQYIFNEVKEKHSPNLNLNPQFI
jgi:hypothetical protein